MSRFIAFLYLLAALLVVLLVALLVALVAPVRAQPANQLVPPRKLVDANSWVCAIDPQEDVQCWLDVQSGSWPSPTLKASPRAFQKVPGVARVVAIEGDYDYVCSLDREGAVHCWGSVWTHERQRLWPKQIALAGPARQIVVEGGAGCALLVSGKVQCWGVATCMPGMRPERLIELSEELETIELPAEPIQLSAGMGTRCALDRQGAVTCWGDICRGYTEPQCTPTRIKLSGVTAIASMCGIVGKERELHCWTGRDGWQTSDYADTSNGCADTRVRNIKHVKQLAVGASSGLALTDEGHVYYWGDAHSGGIANIGHDAWAAETISLAHAVQQGNTGASFEAQAPEVSLGPMRRVYHRPRFELAPVRLPSVPGVRGVIASGHYNCLELDEAGPYCEFVLGRVPFHLEEVWPTVRFDAGRRGSLEGQPARPR